MKALVLLTALLLAAPPPASRQARPAMPCPVTPTWGHLASPYGWRRHPMGGGTGHHWGIDIAAPAGTPVLASMAGTVTFTGWFGGYGITVYVAHGGGWETLYGHLSRVFVAPGQQVACAQVIGAVGSTGNSTGPHLHFELRWRGRPVDPVPYLIEAYRRWTGR